MRRIVDWWGQHQVFLYATAIILGAAFGVLAPDSAPVLKTAANPVLAILLFATFVGVPMIEIGRSFRHLRFLGALVIVNFLIVPAVVGLLSRFVADDRGLLIGVLLVLLTPCVDYVIVFTGLAGGAKTRLLAATPLLMLLQILLLPAYLWFFAGSAMIGYIEVQPFIEAFVIIVVIPLIAAAVVQAAARRHRTGRAIHEASAAATVPLMMLTLAIVVGSQIAPAGGEVITLLRLVPLYVAFLVAMPLVGLAVSRLSRLEMPETRAVIFSGVTRNSLVVLPLALALPAELAIAPLAVATQTLVELVAMVVLVRVVPKLAPRGRGR